MRWLIPRLPRFQLRAPGVEIRLTTSDEPLAPESGFDVAIRRGPGPWPGLRATHFLEESVTPVAAPSLLAKARLKSPRELASVTWLSADTRQDLWPEWLRAHAAASLKPQRSLRFDHYYLALQAAQDGLGVAMGSLTVLGEDLRAGRLAAPFPDLQVRARTYHALYHPRRSATVTKFVSWLEEEGSA
jgi:LysR family glycine cleavage system transcriptional activator